MQQIRFTRKQGNVHWSPKSLHVFCGEGWLAHIKQRPKEWLQLEAVCKALRQKQLGLFYSGASASFVGLTALHGLVQHKRAAIAADLRLGLGCLL